MALNNYMAELMAVKGIECAQLVCDDARIAQNPKLTMSSRQSRTPRRHPTFWTSIKGMSLPPNRPSRKRSDEDLVSLSSQFGSRSSKIQETTKNSLELFYGEVKQSRINKSQTKDGPESEFESMESIESVDEK